MTAIPDTLVDPTACEREVRARAPRRSSLAGAPVLLADATLNKASSWGAGMLDAAARMLADNAEVQCERADLDPLDVRPGQLWVDAVASRYDAVVLAAGDCITCTTRAARNVVLAERSGIPGALVCTVATAPIVRAVGRSLGLPDVAFFPVADSLFGRSRAEIADLVVPYVLQLPQTLTSPDGPGPSDPSRPHR